MNQDLLNPAFVNRIGNYLRRNSAVSPALGSVTSRVRVSVCHPGFFSPRGRGEEPLIAEVLPGRGANPPHIILVDNSNEGFRVERYAGRLGEIARHSGVKRERVIVLTQNEEFWHRESLLTPAKHVNAAVFNRQFTHAVGVARRRPTRRTSVSLRPGHYSHRFLSLNNVPRPQRIALMALMREEGLLDQTAASFLAYSYSPKRNLQDFRQEALLAFPEHGDAVNRFLDQVSFPLVLDQRKRREQMWNLPSVASRCVWFLVTETDFVADYTAQRVRRVTEKTMKALVFGRPFVMVGNPFTLDYLRELGFRTFDTVIDESYDTILGPNERMMAIMSVVRQLASRKITRGYLKELNSIARANQEWLVKGFASLVQGREARSLEVAVERAAL